jgi:hypothetical protein
LCRLAPTIGHRDATYLVRRSRIWQLVGSFQANSRASIPRKEIRITTATGGRQKAHVVEFAEAVADARSFDLVYRPTAQIAEQRLGDIVARVDIIGRAVAPLMHKQVAAVLDGAWKPSLRLSALFESHEALVTARTHGKSDNRLHKSTETSQRAVANLIGMIGDKPIATSRYMSSASAISIVPPALRIGQPLALL